GRVFRLDARIDPDVSVQRPLDVALRTRSGPPPAPSMPHQPAVDGDGVRIEEALEVLGLEIQILMPRIRQRVFAVDGVEHSHGGNWKAYWTRLGNSLGRENYHLRKLGRGSLERCHFFGARVEIV